MRQKNIYIIKTYNNIQNQDKTSFLYFISFPFSFKESTLLTLEKRDKRYLPYIELGHWLCSHFQLETLLNLHKPITQKLYNVEQ